MKAIITVTGADKSGIIAAITEILADGGANVEDISQTIMQGYFMMFMLVNIANLNCAFGEFAEKLAEKGIELGLEIRIQKEEIFKAMHVV